jgi:hypothetical protein
MVKLKGVKDFIVDWKKTFIGTTLTVIAMVVGISTGIIKIWEKAEEIMEASVKVEASRMPIHDHVTYEINKLARRLEKENILTEIEKSKVGVVRVDTLYYQNNKRFSESKLIKQVPNKSKE